jgi:glycosyltransferase involved in cell wall biosynthesis
MFRDEIRDLIEKDKISSESRVLFVDDGSRDSTWQIISSLALEDPVFTGIRQSRNRGHQSSVLAGLMEAKDRADIVISIDCDGQDDVTAMEDMVDAYADGCDIVYGIRSSRESDTFFKRSSAQLYYKLLNAMGAEVVYNHADYRLTSSKVLQEFANFKEVNLYLRGMFPLVGFKSTSVYYERHERLAGSSHYSLAKMLGLAFDGITSLSIKPIRMIAAFGAIMSFLSFIGIIWAVVDRFMGNTVPGWASTVVIIFLTCGLQMLSLGVIGEYIGKIYMESKHRPRYIISEKTYDDADESTGDNN